MKKTLIATAIAGAMSFSVAAQAAPTVYGNIQAVVDLKNDNVLGDNGSTLGFKGEEALDNGLTAIYKAEFHFEVDDTQTAAKPGLGETGDSAYVGVKGDFGTVKAGQFDAIPNDFVYDLVAAPEAANGAYTAFTNVEAKQVAYTGDFGGIEVGAAVKLNGKSATDKDLDNAMQIGVKLPVDAITVAAAYDTYKGAIGVGASMAVDAISVAATFETSDTVDSALSASAAMNYGMGDVYGLFSTGQNKGGKSQTYTAFGANYKLGEPMYVYVEMSSGEDISGGKAEATAVGAVLSF